MKKINPIVENKIYEDEMGIEKFPLGKLFRISYDYVTNSLVLKCFNQDDLEKIIDIYSDNNPSYFYMRQYGYNTPKKISIINTFGYFPSGFLFEILNFIKFQYGSLNVVEMSPNFKMYLNDTGLLFSRMHLTKNKFLTDINIKNIIYENSIAISLINLGYNLYYYQSEGKAEVSFVIQTRNGKILPIELVDKNLSKSKSLTLFMNKTGIKEAIRVTDENFSMKKGVKYIPIYALFCLNEGI